MLKLWLRNRLSISVILVAILSFISSFFFVKPAATINGENRVVTSVYENSEIDYDIPAPTKDQLTEIKGKSFVDDAFGYYFTESSISVNKKSVKAKLLFSEDFDSLEMTMYNNKRLISSSDAKLDNPLYVDYAFAKKYNLSLGNEIKFNGIKLQVGRIYETNSYYDSALFIPLVGAQKDFIESRTKSLSGAYLKVNNENEAETFLKGYKPLGRLKDRSEFETEEAYQEHYKGWNEHSYYNEITNFNAKLSAASTKAEPSYYLGFAISMILLLGVNILLSFRKSERKYFETLKVKKNIQKYYLGSVALDAVLLTVASIAAIAIINIGLINFVPQTLIINMYVAALVMGVIHLVVGLIYNYFFARKVISKK